MIADEAIANWRSADDLIRDLEIADRAREELARLEENVVEERKAQEAAEQDALKAYRNQWPSWEFERRAKYHRANADRSEVKVRLLKRIIGEGSR